VVAAATAGRVGAIDNRRLARAAKLAGAPHDAAAGALIHVRLGDAVAVGQPLITLHAQAPGQLAYALAYVNTQTPIVAIDPPSLP
jgi:thymidine phosphorylase